MNVTQTAPLTASSTVTEIFQFMKERLHDVVPEFELRYKAEIVKEILELKEARNAVILGHNYMEPALFHTIPDFKGDSLELARRAAETDKDVIVFCGVKFMAETAKILNPDKTVLIPSLKAGCSLAASITAEDVRQLKARYPGVPVVTYINTYADVKAECDVCCTSSNAAKVVAALDSDTVIFVPDEFIPRVVENGTRRLEIPDVEADIIGWPGKCEVHEQFTVEDVRAARQQFPDVTVLAHPECPPEVVEAADFSGSTTAMIRFIEQSSAHRYLLLTECSMGDNITAAHPEKEMVRLCSVRCPYMNQITLEQTRDALKYFQYPVTVPEDIRKRALNAVERMLQIG